MEGLTTSGGSITTTPAPDATVIRLSGAIDGGCRQEASQAMLVSLQRQLPVVLETSDVTSIDTAGMAFLIQCGKAGRSEGLPVRLPRASSRVTALLGSLGAEEFFDLAG